MRPHPEQAELLPVTARPQAAATALRPLPRTGAAPEATQLWVAVQLPAALDGSQLEPLAGAVQRFTPRVSLVPPDALLLEVKGSLHLFDGLAGLRAELVRECQHLQVAPLIACAPTPLAALTAARAGKPLVITAMAQLTSQLAPLPLSALRWPDEVRARLARLGVRNLGALLRLPRAGFARRFGVAQLAMLDALTGRSADVRVTFRAREHFRRRRQFSYEIEDHGRLCAALAPLFHALGEFLTARQCGVVELEVRLLHRHAPPGSCVLALAAPCADAARLAALWGEHLRALILPEPVRAAELRAAALLPHLPGSHGLWQPGEHGGSENAATGELIERLRARLGADAVHGLSVRAGHRPESAWARTAPPAPAGTQPPRRASALVAQDAGRRPLWLLPAPQPLAEQGGLPRRCGALRLTGEPERIETGWWDGAEVARDYYTAIDVHGVRLWVFRERGAPHGWFLHGVFG
jgi:protein ImuB